MQQSPKTARLQDAAPQMHFRLCAARQMREGAVPCSILWSPAFGRCANFVSAIDKNRPSACAAILQVIPALEAGGAERTTIDIAAALAREGFLPLVASEGGRLEPELLAAGGEALRMDAATKAPHRIVANAFALRSIITARNVKLVHARSRAPAWSALLAARMARVPFVTTYHGIYNATNAFKRMYNSVMVRSDAVIANSEWTAAHIRREYQHVPEHLEIIPRGVDLMAFDPAGIAPDKISTLRAQWGAMANDIVLLLPGRLTRWKGQLVLIEALADLKRNGGIGNIRAVLAGDAQGRHSYEKELDAAIAAADIDGVVHISGHVGDMATAYLAADVVISASTEPEGFGRVAAEAGAMARPVIATDHGGARETVLPDISGLLTPPGDAGALRAAIAWMAAMGTEARIKMGQRGRAHIIAHYTKEKMCADTLGLYRKLIQR
jgi:glycosyltransferase involved in cell wall biosynthesis